MKILKVRLIHKADTGPHDISHIGEYTDDPEDGNIITIGPHEGEFVEDLDASGEPLPERGRDYRFFKPYAGGLTDPKSPDYREYARQDYLAARGLARGDWFFMGVMAEAEIQLTPQGPVQRISSGGVWGVESDAGDYLEEVEIDELESLGTELVAMGFPPKTVMQALGRKEVIEE